jgi:hypothetical protein
MLSPEIFKTDILQVLISRFANDPDSLADAYSLIWAVDSYAVHCAQHIGIDETKFKNCIQQRGAWQFRVIREASSAGKHAVCSNEKTRDVARSDRVMLSEDAATGWSSYFANSKHDGPQICIQLSWFFDEETRSWFDANNKPVGGGGPFLSVVPLLDLVDPAIFAIESTTSENRR